VSIAAMTDARIQRRRPKQQARAQERGVPDVIGGAAAAVPLPAANALVRYIPTEAVAIYVAILAGAFQPLRPKPGQPLDQLDFTSRWLFLGIFLIATAGLVWLLYIGKARSAGEPYGDVPLFEMAVAAIALAGWAFALPDSPLADFSFYGGWLPPVVLGLTTLTIPAVAAALGRTPTVYEQGDDES
jgi:hypothetical protein